MPKNAAKRSHMEQPSAVFLPNKLVHQPINSVPATNSNEVPKLSLYQLRQQAVRTAVNSTSRGSFPILPSVSFSSNSPQKPKMPIVAVSFDSFAQQQPGITAPTPITDEQQKLSRIPKNPQQHTVAAQNISSHGIPKLPTVPTAIKNQNLTNSTWKKEEQPRSLSPSESRHLHAVTAQKPSSKGRTRLSLVQFLHLSVTAPHSSNNPREITLQPFETHHGLQPVPGTADNPQQTTHGFYQVPGQLFPSPKQRQQRVDAAPASIIKKIPVMPLK
ncbi:hypothetical protein LXL04_039285 [Taraxacum kok-saghyz]